MEKRENYLCVLDLLGFAKLTLTSGDDMLSIRTERLAKDFAEAVAGFENRVLCKNVAFWLFIYTQGDSDEDLEALLKVVSKYNKHALMFGHPHKGIVLRQSLFDDTKGGFSVFSSKALFCAMELLKTQNTAGVCLDKDLAQEKHDLAKNYCAGFGGLQLLRIIRTPLAKVAFDGIRNSVEKNFQRAGIDKFSSDFPLLATLLQFLGNENDKTL